MTTSFRQQVLIYEQRNNINMNTPRLVTMIVSLRAIYTVYITQGIWLGVISAILTAMCVAPLFFDVSILRANAPRIPAASEAIITSPIVLFTQSILRELTILYHDEHSTSGRMAQSIIETLNECIHDLNYVAQVLLRENQGLLVLLIGGISTMALALVAGLDGVNGLKAVLISITCDGVTTILVARSARRIVNQQTAMILSHKPKLSSAEVQRIVEAIPEENFVRNDDLETCDCKCLTNMLHHRQTSSQSSNCPNPGRSSMKENEEYCTPSPHNSQPKKECLIANIQQRRNYNDTCCICLSPFVRDERIRVLPSCRHEFHVGCIDKWAQTFAADIRLQYCNVKSGSPTCPLCKTCL